MPKTSTRSKAKKMASAVASTRKDHVLQARVPSSLYEELLEKAAQLRVPVSNLIRNILEDSVRMVGNIVESSFEISQALSGQVNPHDLKDVVGWQPVIANRELICSKCAQTIPKGEQAFVSLGAPSGKNYFLCGKCQ